VSFTRGNLQTARELGEQLLDVAQNVPGSPFLLMAHAQLGSTLFMLGKTGAARTLLEQAVALYEPEKHRPMAVSAGVDPGMATLSNLADLLWFLGYADQAQQRSEESLRAAQETPHPFNLAVAFDFAARRHQFRHEAQATRERAEAAITICAEHGFLFRLALATTLHGWALVEQGEEKEGIAQLQRGRELFRATGVSTWGSYYSALLAEAYGKIGQPEEGLSLLGEMFALLQRTGERWWEAELYRLRGELTLQQQLKVQSSEFKDTAPRSLLPDPQSEAETCFLKAIEIAQKQQAKSLELRATMSLARLRRQRALEQGARSREQRARTTHHVPRTTQHVTRTALDEARDMLSEIYTWFTEGFDTKDLQEAKALLVELA
jgi:predicted ATPase